MSKLPWCILRDKDIAMISNYERKLTTLCNQMHSRQIKTVISELFNEIILPFRLSTSVLLCSVRKSSQFNVPSL